jgi:hypothetical protein
VNPYWIIGLQSLSWDVAIRTSLAALPAAMVGLEKK